MAKPKKTLFKTQEEEKKTYGMKIPVSWSQRISAIEAALSDMNPPVVFDHQGLMRDSLLALIEQAESELGKTHCEEDSANPVSERVRGKGGISEADSMVATTS